MALDGGGGGGGPVGIANSFTGTAETLEIVGDHCMAYSGNQAIGGAGQDVPSTLLEFTTGNYYVDIKLQATRGYPSNIGHDYLWIVYLNGTAVYEFFDGNGDFNENPIHLVIPAYTEVKVTTQNSTSGADNNVGVAIAGRIYR